MRGSWTLAQIYFHLAAAFEGSMEGLPPGYSRIARMIVRPMRSFVTNVRFPPHPVLGAFTKEEWTGFHLRHSEHHLSFVRDKG